MPLSLYLSLYYAYISGLLLIFLIKNIEALIQAREEYSPLRNLAYALPNAVAHQTEKSSAAERKVLKRDG